VFALDYTAAKPEAIIPIAVEVETHEPIDYWTLRVNGTEIGQSSQLPITWSWVADETGAYLIEASLQMASGSTHDATPLRIEVVQEARRLLLIEEASTFQSQFITQALFEMGLAWESAPLDRCPNLNPANFDGVIWKHSIQEGQLPNPGVETLVTWHRAGMPIYHMSAPLDQVALSTDPTPMSQAWSALTGINRIHSQHAPQRTSLLRDPATQTFWDGPFGPVQWLTPMPAGLWFEPPKSASILLTEALQGNSTMIIQEASLDSDQGRLALQSFAWGQEGDAQQAMVSEDHQTLFKNTLCWLIACQSCPNFDLSIQIEPPQPAEQTPSHWVFEGRVQHLGECLASGTYVDLTWDDALSLVALHIETGWSEVLPGRLRWHLGGVGSNQHHTFTLEMRAPEEDAWLLAARIEPATLEAYPANNSWLLGKLAINDPNNLSPLRLFDGTPGLYLPPSKTGEPWQLEGSQDLIHWMGLSRHQPEMMIPMPLDQSGLVPWRFFRLRHASPQLKP